MMTMSRLFAVPGGDNFQANGVTSGPQLNRVLSHLASSMIVLLLRLYLYFTSRTEFSYAYKRENLEE